MNYWDEPDQAPHERIVRYWNEIYLLYVLPWGIVDNFFNLDDNVHDTPCYAKGASQSMPATINIPYLCTCLAPNQVTHVIVQMTYNQKRKFTRGRIHLECLVIHIYSSNKQS